MNPNSKALQAGSALLNYVSALENKDIDAVASMTNEGTVWEIPYLKPNRLIGRLEISKGHAEIFKTLKSLSVTLHKPLENKNHVIAEGELRVLRKSGAESRHQIGFVVEIHAGYLKRISLYADSRNTRLWSDKSIL
jgi:ketosteroid isomerase-like protein